MTDKLRTDGTGASMADVEQASVPRWALKLLMRLGTLRKGEVYRLTVVMQGDEPVWTVESVGRLENWRELPIG